jgi:DNA-binding NarL/FixJ family response regulator
MTKQTSEMHKILIIEDHPIMREGIVKWIEGDPLMTVCGDFGSSVEAMGALGRLQPDLVVCDITLGDTNGLELLKDMIAFDPQLPVIMLSMHDESIFAMRAMRAGARGYVVKAAGGMEVVRAIKQVLGGGYAFSPKVSNQLIGEMAGRAKGRRSPVAALTDREFEILQHYGAGQTSGEIARALHLSPKTVGTHRLNICQKLSLKSTAELIRFAVHHLEAEMHRTSA